MACQGNIPDYWCPGWRLRARLIRERDGKRCLACGSKARRSALHVHHIKYARTPTSKCGSCILMGVADRDLVTLCKTCHDKHHGRYRPRPVVRLLKWLWARF